MRERERKGCKEGRRGRKIRESREEGTGGGVEREENEGE